MDGMQLNLLLPPQKPSIAPKRSTKRSLVKGTSSSTPATLRVGQFAKKSVHLKAKTMNRARPKILAMRDSSDKTKSIDSANSPLYSSNETLKKSESPKTNALLRASSKRKRSAGDVTDDFTGAKASGPKFGDVVANKRSKWFGDRSNIPTIFLNAPQLSTFDSEASKPTNKMYSKTPEVTNESYEKVVKGKNGQLRPQTKSETKQTIRNSAELAESEPYVPYKRNTSKGMFADYVLEETFEDVNVEPLEENLFSSESFQDVNVHPHLVGNLKQLFGIENMTVVQKKTIPILMAGKDALVRSQTGSGKTLAYAIPIMNALQQASPKLTRKDGVKALVILPTRELATQTYEVFSKLMRAFTWIVPGLVIGGEKRKSEKVRLRKGITVLIGTPGRLLDHAKHTGNLSFHQIDWLVVDEADKLLELGYGKDISELTSIIEQQEREYMAAGRKQAALLSATLTSEVEKLASSMLKDPVYVDACSDVHETTDVMIIPQTLDQKFVIVPAKLRLVTLSSFLVKCTELEKSGKVLVFMAGQDMVDFYASIIATVFPLQVPFFKLHGNMSQTDRTEVFNSFRKSERGVLFCTDVAARGLDFPQVDWILQYTAPTCVAEYVHRVGRTARVGSTGSALLFLLPSEMQFISLLNSSRIKLNEVSLESFLSSLTKIRIESKIDMRDPTDYEAPALALQQNFERAVLEDDSLHELACKAYKSWVRFYATYNKDLRVVFNFKKLHLGHNAKSFALQDPPRAIGGIGRPQKMDLKSAKLARTRLVKHDSSKRKLIVSEFDSGLKPFKK